MKRKDTGLCHFVRGQHIKEWKFITVTEREEGVDGLRHWERLTEKEKTTKWTAAKLSRWHRIKWKAASNFKHRQVSNGTGQQDKHKQTDISVRWTCWKQGGSDWMTQAKKDTRAGWFVTWLTWYWATVELAQRSRQTEDLNKQQRKRGWC